MSLPLLTVKIQPPPASPALVVRPRLLARLDGARHPACRLALVSAPAGYGKTTLLCAWATAQGDSLPCAWLALDRGDNDLARFLTYLVAALQRVQPQLGAETLAALRTPRPPDAAALGRLLCAELAAVEEPLAIVLDDYHVIESGAVHELVSLLVENQPHLLVIASRADPPLPLARLRARGQLVEIRQADLAFTEPEAAAFLEGRLGSALAPGQINLLERRTEGWATGLQLAALSLQHNPDPQGWLDDFSGRQPYIADYLVEEVLAQQPEPVQDFLLQTSILERLSAGLCTAVTGQTDAGQTLARLVRANLFLQPLDTKGEWFRYHGLLVDLLRKRLVERQRELLPELHLRASQWYHSQELPLPAIEHALAAGDYPRAAGWMEQTAGRVLLQGETHTLLGWIAALPETLLSDRPQLAVYEGLGLLMANRSPQPALDRLAEFPRDELPAAAAGGEATVRALQAVVAGQPAEAVEQAQRALDTLPPETAFLRSLAADSLGMAHTLRGETQAAAQAFEQVVESASRDGNQPLTLLALSNLAGLRYLHGQLGAAKAAFQEVLDQTRAQAGVRSQARAKALLGLGEIARERGELDAARDFLQAAEESLQPLTDFGGPMVTLSLARVALAKGDRVGAQQALVRARQQAQASRSTQLDDSLVDNLQARFWIQEGQLGQAEDWARQQGLLDESTGALVESKDPRREAQHMQQGNLLTLARLLIARGQPQPARQVLSRALETARSRGHIRRVIEIQVLQAQAWHAEGEETRALDSLEQALRLAEPEGFRQLFVEDGAALAPLLYRAVAQGRAAAYAGSLLAALPVETTPLRAAQDDLIEPLSPRELEVLALLNQGLTNQQIAERLYITLSTVKGHTSEIYGKLGVKNRSQAAARARQLGLLG